MAGTETPRVVICAHKPLSADPRFPQNRPRGGEKSVGLIRDYLSRHYPVLTAVANTDTFSDHIRPGDVALTWGIAAEETMMACQARGAPFILMVRWFRNVCPVPPVGDLRFRVIPPAFRERKKLLFDRASTVICNNRYTAEVVERIYDRPCEVSYVPVSGGLAGHGNPEGPVVLVTDGKGLGAERIVLELAGMLPGVQFQIINATSGAPYGKYQNITVLGYTDDMEKIWSQAGIMIYPAYDDVCGTSRVAPEAMRHGVPCLANDRSGICEKGMISIPRDASSTAWAHTIEKIYSNYPAFSNRMRETYRNYDSPGELSVYHEAIKSAFSV